MNSGFRSIQSLEPRALLAVDLTCSTAAVVTRYAFGPAAGVVEMNLTLHNAGTTATSPDVGEITFVFTKDRIVGNADDFADEVNTTFFNDSVPALGDLVLDGEFVARPGGMFAGRYFVAVVVDSANEISETNEANNVFITNNTITVVSKEWPSASLAGTLGNDVITIHQEVDDNAFITVNGETRWHDWEGAFINGSSGHDWIVADPDVLLDLAITGSGGNDIIVGGSRNDELSGATGRDRVFGGGGHDYLLGGASNDYLNGEGGNDTMSGAGGSDRIFGIDGLDYLLGGGGHDLLFSRDATTLSDPDTLSGGFGIDRAQIDSGDLQAGLEGLLA